MRGKHVDAIVNFDEPRITPAGAGKTLFQQRHCQLTQDHPRRCGENGIAEVESADPKGSPPQVRGKHPLKISFLLDIRITPAGAGKTDDEMVELHNR